jgi:hypothetical protein
MAGRDGEAGGPMVPARAGRRRQVIAGTDDEESDHGTAGAGSSAQARPRRRPADADGDAVGAGAGAVAREEEESSEERDAEGPRAGGDMDDDEDVRGPSARYARHCIFETGMCLPGKSPIWASVAVAYSVRNLHRSKRAVEKGEPDDRLDIQAEDEVDEVREACTSASLSALAVMRTPRPLPPPQCE